MKLVYEGKTKNLYSLDNGNFVMEFKDDVTGTDGKFDPGANQVGLSIEGMGNANIKLTSYFFEMLKKHGVKTHYVASDVSNNTMEVLPATVFGKGVEVICRFKAVGSFMRRYGLYASEGQELDAFVEITLKDDERNDPPITRDCLALLGIITNEQYDSLKEQTKKICKLIKEDLSKYGLELFDIKLEFGNNNGQVILIDEISGGNMRVYKDGNSIEPLELAKIVLGSKQ